MAYTPPSGSASDFALTTGYTERNGDEVNFPGSEGSGAELSADASIQVSASAALRTGARLSADAEISAVTEPLLTTPDFVAAASIGIAGSARLSTVYFVAHATVEVSGFALGMNPDLGLGTGLNGPAVGFPYTDAPPKQRGWTAAHEVSRQLNTPLEAPWDAPRPVDPHKAAAWTWTEHRDAPVAAPWDRFEQTLGVDTLGPWGFLPTKDPESRFDWPDDLQPRDAQNTDGWVWLTPRDIEHEAPHMLADPYGEPYYKPPPYTVPTTPLVAFSAESGHTPPVSPAVNFALRPDTTGRRAVATERCPRPFPWKQGTPKDDISAYPWDPEISRVVRDQVITIPIFIPIPIEDDPGAPPILRSYSVMPSIAIVRLPERTLVHSLSCTITTDRDSWGWTLNLTLATTEDLDLVIPDPVSGPRTIEVTVNGYVWEFIIESYRRSRTFGNNALQVAGRSKAALLTDRYAPRSSYTEDGARTAAQLASEALTNTGWTLIWSAPNWFVPAGSFSYQNLAPLDVVRRVAQSIGARVACDPTDNILTIVSTYPYAPWEDPADPEYVIPENIVTALDGEWAARPGYNSIYCAGAANGVLVQATIAGSGGDSPAPMVVDPLITHVEAGRERGRFELASGGNRILHTLRLPLFPSPELPGLILPGHVCKVGSGIDTWLGLASGITITANRTSALSVRQSVTLEQYQ